MVNSLTLFRKPSLCLRRPSAGDIFRKRVMLTTYLHIILKIPHIAKSIVFPFNFKQKLTILFVPFLGIANTPSVTFRSNVSISLFSLSLKGIVRYWFKMTSFFIYRFLLFIGICFISVPTLASKIVLVSILS
jgi:hypothetical protein